MTNIEKEEATKVFQVWAAAKDGDGMVQDLGQYEDVDQIAIHTSTFAPDVLITIERIWHGKKD